MTNQLPPIQIVQTGYVVSDLRAACQRFHDIYRIGPFLHVAPHPIVEVRYRGKPAHIEVESAFAQCGNIQIELISQLNEGPSAYRDAYAPGESGLHHVATWATDYEAELQAYRDGGFDVTMEMPRPEGSVVYVDTRSAVGHMIELYPDSDKIREQFEDVRKMTATDSPELMIPYQLRR